MSGRSGRGRRSFLSCGQTMRREPYFLLNCWRSSLIPLARCFIQTRCRRRKDPINLKTTEIDMLSLSGHKLHGPKGIGALYVRKGVKYKPLIRGVIRNAAGGVALRTRRQSSGLARLRSLPPRISRQNKHASALCATTLSEVWSSGSAIASLTVMSRTGCQTRPISHLSTSMVRRSCLT